jgi:hypothetical protein
VDNGESQTQSVLIQLLFRQSKSSLDFMTKNVRHITTRRQPDLMRLEVTTEVTAFKLESVFNFPELQDQNHTYLDIWFGIMGLCQ